MFSSLPMLSTILRGLVQVLLGLTGLALLRRLMRP